jgi:hypothetical protein
MIIGASCGILDTERSMAMNAKYWTINAKKPYVIGLHNGRDYCSDFEFARKHLKLEDIRPEMGELYLVTDSLNRYHLSTDLCVGAIYYDKEEKKHCGVAILFTGIENQDFYNGEDRIWVETEKYKDLEKEVLEAMAQLMAENATITAFIESEM